MGHQEATQQDVHPNSRDERKERDGQPDEIVTSARSAHARHATHRQRTATIASPIVPLLVLAVALMCVIGWTLADQAHRNGWFGLGGSGQTQAQSSNAGSASGGDASNSTGSAANGATALDNKTTTPKPAAEHHGNSPDCPDTDCISILVNGDLLFHAGLWNQFAVNPTATDGTAFDFTNLFEPLRKYIDASDIAICEFETPIAQRGGPYSAYPIFNIPPEVADAAAKVGYRACTHATNHSWDQGAAGIARLWDTLEADGIAQTGSYKNEADSTKPLVIDSPTGGGKLGLVTGTVSLNGMTADQDWQVDRLRESGDPHHQSDIDRAVAKAKAAREQGADVVAIAMHSVQEYLDYADSWQQSEAHELADTGAFDVIYGAGCHCAQPIENYNGTWIVYGLGNTVTETAGPDTIVNNQGVTARIQFAGKKGQSGTWHVTRIDWTPSANETRGKYQWCSLASDHPDGTCWNETQDAAVRERIANVIYSMGADRNVVREWDITAEQAAKQLSGK